MGVLGALDRAAHDHGTSDAASTCWYCNYNTDAKGPLHWTNGLDLDVSYADDRQTDDRQQPDELCVVGSAST